MNRRALSRMICAVTLTAALAGASISAVTAEASNHAATKKIFVFAYFPHALAPATWAWYNGWVEGAAKLGPGYKLVVKEEASLDEDPGSFLSFIKTGMVQEPDGVIVVSNNSVALAPGLRQIQAQYSNVKFLAMDQPVPQWNDVAFVGTNNYAAGAQAARWMMGAYAKHSFPSNEIAVFRAPPGAASQDQRVAGFLATIKKSPLKVVKTIESPDSSNTAALKNMADVLTGHPNLGGVFSATDNYGLGVAEELVRAHKTNIVNVSIDADTPAVEAIISHKGMNAEIAQHFKRMGYMAVMTLGHAMSGQTVAKTVDTGTTLVTTANARTYLKQAAAEGKAS